MIRSAIAMALTVALITLVVFISGKLVEPGSNGEVARRAPASVSTPRVEIRIVFGYKDARPARFVGDRYERLALVSNLTEPCSGARLACGFGRSEEDADLLVKEMKRTRSGEEGPLRATIRIVHSSAGPDDVANRLDTHQQWLSAKAESEFLSALENSAAVFYIGHSRDGGGPSFYPPHLRSDGRVDYDHHVREARGKKLLVAALGSREVSASELGLLSCYSTQHFRKTLSRARPGIRLVTSDDLIYYTDALDLVESGIERALARATR